MNIYETILQENSGNTGVIAADGGRTFTFPELTAAVEAFSGALKKNGVSEQCRAGLLADDSFEYVAASLGVLSMNAAIVPLSTRASETELEQMPDRVELNFLITTEKYHRSGDIELKLPDFFRFPLYLRKYARDVKPIELPDGELPAFIRFSSGTTGLNKGVVLSHRSVIERTSACTALDVSRGDNVLWVLDMAFHFVVTILLFLRRGAVTVISPRPLESEMIKCIRQYPPVLLYATPYHYRLMIHSPDFRKEDLSTVRRAFSTAMKLEQTDAELFTRKFGLPLNQAYGIIEVGLPCVNCTAERSKYASVGRIQSAYQVRIQDPDSNGTGDILIHGSGMFDAYLSPFKLRAEVCPDGWFSTGDSGYIDSDGFLFICGRTKNLINFAGMKIFPYEVESVLTESGIVRDAVVYAKPFPGVGEIPAADVVLNENAPADWLIQLRRFCFSRLAEYKVPKEFNPVSAIPRTASGKIIRRK